MTATIPSFEEYEHARHVLAHSTDFELPEVNTALTWINEFETAVRDAVADRFRVARERDLRPEYEAVVMLLPAWEDMALGMQEALFDAAMVGARTAGGAR